MSVYHIHKTTGLIHRKGVFVGSAVIFPWKGDLYVVTAGHNIYGKTFGEVPSLSEFCVTDYNGICHSVYSILGNPEFAKTYDIVMLKLECNTDLGLFVEVKFCTVSKNPMHTYMFRGKYEGSGNAVTHRKLEYHVDHQSLKFLCRIDRDLLSNSDYKSGSAWLGGWSGSGLFIDNHPELFCSGIMCEIPNSGNDGQIMFSQITALSAIGFEPVIHDSRDFDCDIVMSAKALKGIIDSVDEKSILEWEENQSNSPQLLNLKRKLKQIYPDVDQKLNRTKIIKQIMAGQTYITAELSKHEQLYELHETAFQIYRLDDESVVVNNRSEALRALTGIKNKYEQYLIASLSEKFSAMEIKLLAQYGISEWIADCGLNFIPNE